MVVEFLPFRIAGRDFVVDASRVRALVPFDRFDPATQPTAVPMFDLRERLYLPPVFYGHRPVLVVLETALADSGTAGFVADYVADVIQGSPEDCRRGKLRGAGRSKWLLDPDSLRIAG